MYFLYEFAILEVHSFSTNHKLLTFASVAVSAIFKALLRTLVAEGAKAAAEPTRRVAIESFILLQYLLLVCLECWKVRG